MQSNTNAAQVVPYVGRCASNEAHAVPHKGAKLTVKRLGLISLRSCLLRAS